MEFCPKCGAILMLKNKKLVCKCGYITEKEICLEISEKLENNKIVGVVKEGQKEVLPITDFKCEKCGNDKAYFWTRQTVDGDEPESEFYKCTKCGNVVREEDF